MPVYRLDDELWFPDPRLGEEDGLVAVGGDLSPRRLLLAYSYGFFPWYAYRYAREPLWYCPLDRFVIFPDEIHVSHSMRTLINKGRYSVTFNEAFPEVIGWCSRSGGRGNEAGAWLGPDMISAYTEMHRLGFGKSVEVWEPDPDAPDGRRLVGGLYGLQVGRGFFGESMFSLVPGASKLALIHLGACCMGADVELIDCQFETPHLLSMGGRHISYDEYLLLIRKAD